MSTKRTQYRQLPAKPIAYSHLHHIQDIGDQNVNNLVDDILGGGLISWTVEPNSPVDLSVLVTINSGWSSDGKRLQIAQTEISLSSLVPDSGYTWASVWAVFSWDNSDTVIDGNGNSAVPSRVESVTFSVSAGSANVLPVNPGGGAVRVCSVRLASTTTTITSSMIKTTGKYADEQVTLDNVLPLAGGVLTGSVVYSDGSNNHALVYSNTGKGMFGDEIHDLGTTGDEDYDNHFMVSTRFYSSRPAIRTGIAKNNLKLNLLVNMRVYSGNDGSVVYAWIDPFKIRFGSDVAAETPSEMLLAIFDEDANGDLTGDIYLYAIGSKSWVSRFAGRPFKWTAVCPMENYYVS